MSETRKLAAILVADIVGYSRLAGADEDRILARLRTLRSDLIDPTVAVHHGRFVKRTGDGAIIEFRSVVDAVRCAIEVQNGMAERNAGLPEDQRIEFRVGIHVGDVVEEADGDLMGDGVNIAARLEGVAKPGGIALSEDAYRQVKARLELKVSDLGLTPLKNIIEPIRVYSLEVGTQAAEAPPILARKATPLNERARLSIVVLPFVNFSGDPEQEYFVDGVTESLTTDLSRISGSFVIARNTAFTFKGKSIDVKTIGRELNVRYVLEGSVQRGGNRMRVNVQLVDAETGNHLWAERFDQKMADLFDVQDEIVARLARQLGAELIAVEARRAEKAPHPDVFDLYLQGMAWLNKGAHPLNMQRARAFFERALATDPNNVDALVGSATVDYREALNYSRPDAAANLASAEFSLSKALSAAPGNALAHLWLGLIKIFSNRAVQGIAEAECALALDRNLAGALVAIGVGKQFTGQADETEGYVLRALHLSPRDPFAYAWMVGAGSAKLDLGLYEESVPWLRRALDADPNFPLAHFSLAAALAMLGHLEEARAEVEAGLTLNPQFTIKNLSGAPARNNPLFNVQRRNFYEGLRRAGLPEE